MMAHESEGKRSGSIDGFDSDDASSPSFTLGEYEIEEVSLRRAAKLLRRSKSHSAKLRPAAGMSEEKTPKKTPVVLNIPELPSLGRPVRGYEVEEIEPEKLATWMFEKETDSGDAGES